MPHLHFTVGHCVELHSHNQIARIFAILNSHENAFMKHIDIEQMIYEVCPEGPLQLYTAVVENS